MVQEVVKAATGRYTAVELITQREQARSGIEAFRKRYRIGYSMNIGDFAIANFKLSRQLTGAIETKLTAGQYALKAQRDLE